MMRSMSPLQDLDAVQVAAQYASGALSPVEFTRACLERIDAWEPRLNAMYRVDRDGALASAKAAETRWRAKKPLSPLDGVPVTIKENIYTEGDPAPIGTLANEDAAPQPDDGVRFSGRRFHKTNYHVYGPIVVQKLQQRRRNLGGARRIGGEGRDGEGGDERT